MVSKLLYVELKKYLTKYDGLKNFRTRNHTIRISINTLSRGEIFPFEIPKNAKVILKEPNVSVYRSAGMYYMCLYKSSIFRIDFRQNIYEGFIKPHEAWHPEFITNYLIFPLLNFVLSYHNVFFLHCSSVIANGKYLLLFSGMSGAGKSTIVRMLCRDEKISFFSDDKLAVSGNKLFSLDSGKTVNIDRLKVSVFLTRVRKNRKSVLKKETRNAVLSHILSKNISPILPAKRRERFAVFSRLAERATPYSVIFGKNMIKLKKEILETVG